MNCVQFSLRAKILVLKNQFWRDGTVYFKRHTQLDVHKQFHGGTAGNQVVTLEGIDVCSIAWYIIMGVSKTSFCHCQGYAEQGMRGEHHGNLGSKKPRMHIVQVTTTLRCLLENSADHMPHKSKALENGEKVASISLPTSWKWKE